MLVSRGANNLLALRGYDVADTDDRAAMSCSHAEGFTIL